MESALLQGLHVLDSNELATTDYPHAITYALDFGHDVGREEDGPPFSLDLLYDGVELLLHQWIEAAGRLVHDYQLRPVHERLHQSNLLPVAARERPDLLVQLAGQPFGQTLDMIPVDAAAQIGEVCEKLSPCYAFV